MPNEQIHSLETGKGHCRWPSGLRTARQNGDKKRQPSLWTSVCCELNSRTSKAAAADFSIHANTL